MSLLIARLFATQHFVQSFDDLAVFDGIREMQAWECVDHTTLLLVQDRCGSGLHIGKNLLRRVRPILNFVLYLVTEFVSENVFAPLQRIAGLLRICLHGFTELRKIIGQIDDAKHCDNGIRDDKRLKIVHIQCTAGKGIICVTRFTSGCITSVMSTPSKPNTTAPSKQMRP